MIKSKQKIFHSKLKEFRIKQIIKFKKKHTLKEVGEKFHLTSERVRQILLLKHRKFCKIHNRFFYNKCSYCLDKYYKDWVKKVDFFILSKEIEKESNNKKRDYLSVQRRIVLIKILHSKYKKSFITISKLLKKDYTTIVYLYNKNIDD